MNEAKPVLTPLATMPTLTLHSGSVLSKLTEYRAVTGSELIFTIHKPPVIYCDNVGATHLCSNPVFHSHMKHVAVRFQFIHGEVQSGALRVAHVSTEDQLSGALTKPLPQD
ncbi:hypothetical protein BUALT_Bualt06G0000800 [Buddleja alternifolia]|uniref:Uncharacterized protein n=1 Tax=Buddleja alternifolia TaxID=168488 RepID=A0AAV6XMK5_9LAMI|nr:hypothetical protein BUALT_Bualt06G0000800 [Buddleja alternifolia]